MNRLIKGALLVSGVAVFTVVVLTGVLGAFAKVVDPGHYCDTGFSNWVSCTVHWSSKSTHQSTPLLPSNSATVLPSSSRDTFKPDTTDITMWAVARCPENYIVKRLLCSGASVAAPVQTASNDLASTLPLPKPWVVRTAKNSPFIEAVHVETPLDLAAVLRFYRSELGKRGWVESDGAVVEPDSALIAFTSADGPAQLRLIHQDDRTIADLSLHKLAATDAGILPAPGQARLLVGNTTDEEAIITINEQIIDLPAHAGDKLSEEAQTARKSRDNQEIDLPPGKYLFTFKTASGAVQKRQFTLVADETWGLLVGPGGVPLPVHLY
jgi:hypothetical protein